MVSHEADDVVRADVEFKTNQGRFIDVAQDAGKKIRTASDRAKSFELLKISAREQPRAGHMENTCIIRETPYKARLNQN